MTRQRKDKRRTIYEELGYGDRYDYFTAVSNAFKIPIMKVILKAEVLGQEQDFDELLEWAKEQYNVI